MGRLRRSRRKVMGRERGHQRPWSMATGLSTNWEHWLLAPESKDALCRTKALARKLLNSAGRGSRSPQTPCRSECGRAELRKYHRATLPDLA